MTTINGAPLTANQQRAQFTLKPVPVRPPRRADPADPVAFAAALAGLLVDVTSCPDREAGWTVISRAAAALVTGAEHADIIAVAGRQPEGPTEPLTAVGGVGSLMQVHRAAGDGPCVDVAAGGEQVLVHDLHTDSRWPRFTTRAPWQVRSLLCTPLDLPRKAVGVLTLWSTRAWAFDDTSSRQAALVGTFAALAISHWQQVTNLQAMTDSRDLIGQGKGILMQRHGLKADDAFGVLARASQNHNMKLRDVCQYLCDTGELPIRAQ